MALPSDWQMLSGSSRDRFPATACTSVQISEARWRIPGGQVVLYTIPLLYRKGKQGGEAALAKMSLGSEFPLFQAPDGGAPEQHHANPECSLSACKGQWDPETGGEEPADEAVLGQRLEYEHGLALGECADHEPQANSDGEKGECEVQGHLQVAH